MAETFGFYDTEELVDGSYDREYVAQQWADYFKLFIGTGVFASPTNQLKVIAGEGMNIIVKKGWAFIEGRWYHNDADLVLPVQPNTTASTITSGVFIQANSANREIKAVIATGRTTPDRESPYYELELAQIQLATGTTSITDAMITDMRTDESVCGFVKGLLEGVIPTADLFLQFESQFSSWFQNVKNQLDTDAAGHLQNAIDKLNKKTHTNLINPLLETRVVNGITCTSNGDGTYTLNGTATANAYYVVDNNLTLELGETYKLVGCPGGGAGNLYKLALFDDAGKHQIRTDFGEGSAEYTNNGLYESFRIYMVVSAGVTVNNLVFKPMLTTDISATYDDFVPYSGGSGKLNHDVAEMYRNFSSALTSLKNTAIAQAVGATGNFLSVIAKLGAIVNRGKVTRTLSPGESYTIPEGFHNGQGIVRAISAIQTEIYNAYTRGTLDMGSTNNYRYVNTSGVPNNNTAQGYLSSNGNHDLGATHNYRYIQVDTTPSATLINKTNLGASEIRDGYVTLSGYKRYLVFVLTRYGTYPEVTGANATQIFKEGIGVENNAGVTWSVWLCTTNGDIHVYCSNRLSGYFVIGLN